MSSTRRVPLGVPFEAPDPPPMTAAEWAVCRSAAAMIRHLDPHAYDRRLRLFAAACCRRVWGLVAEPEAHALVAASERYADPGCTRTSSLAP